MVSRETILRKVAAWAGVNLEEKQLTLLSEFGGWLKEEAVTAGGVGPREINRLEERHLADSLSFARGWRGAKPERLFDLGSGVGLPGIPLAIALPRTELVLVDSSARRVGLARRAVRVLGLENVEVERRQISSLKGVKSAVMRAVLPTPRATAVLSRLRVDAAVIGLSRSEKVHVLSPVEGYQLLVERVSVLDPVPSLLIMGRRGTEIESQDNRHHQPEGRRGKIDDGH